ncbi:MAG: tetratricopeptide repeat protein [Acidobacteria bacterium]|nr:tetratricopeptide repeat protein [Acidobacteriota bacterium]MBI3664523.1 tetratricopeptide repeat protein [Acidobacteriota bacterium]
MSKSTGGAARALQSPEDLTGATVGRFLIRAQLGTGAMGEVYRAEDTVLKRTVALKRIAPTLQADPYYRDRFLKEAERASSLTHSRIAGIFDVLEDPHGTFLVMEYVEGQTLRQRLGRPMGVTEFLGIAKQCTEALVAAHEKRIVHCDIKPENILLTPSGDVKVLDFGVAKRQPKADDVTSADTLDETRLSVGGTFIYMAPEVMLERVIDPRSDLFSLGVVFYEALSGRHPFRAGSLAATTNRVLHEPPAPLREVIPDSPPALNQIVERLLVKDPAARYATAGDLLADLRAFERGLPLATAPVPTLPAAPRRWIVWTAVAAGVVLLGALMAALPPARRWVAERAGVAVMPREKHVAVLPFEVVGGDAQAQAFADGLTSTLTAKLARFTQSQALQVVPASIIRRSHVMDAEKARTELGVNLVLEGSLHQQGGRVRVTYSLVDARNRRVLQADSITEAMADPFAMEDRVVDGALRMLELKVQPEEREVLTAHGTTVASAYDFYLRGRGYLQNYDKPENLDGAVSVFEQALKLDPDYALAYAGLGDAYWLKYEAHNEARWVEASRKACERAQSLNAKLPEAHVCLGTLHVGTGKYEMAVQAFQKALETDALNDDAYRGLARAYQRLGQAAEAEQVLQKAISVRPHYWAGYNWLGVFYWREGRLGEATKMFEQVVKLTPDSFQAHYNLGAMYLVQGRYPEAITTLERSIALRPTAEAHSNLATAYFGLRQYADAARTYEQALQIDRSDFIVWGNLGEAYYWAEGRRGESAEAFRRAIALAEEKRKVNPRDAYVLGNLAFYHAMRGEKEAALNFLRRGFTAASKGAGVQFKAALVYAQFRDTERTLEWLEKALAAGTSVPTVRDHPIFDFLRQDPRFQRLLQKK